MPGDRPARNGKRDFGCEARLRKRRTLKSFSPGRYVFDDVFVDCGAGTRRFSWETMPCPLCVLKDTLPKRLIFVALGARTGGSLVTTRKGLNDRAH
jgi:hypothetical protein